MDQVSGTLLAIVAVIYLGVCASEIKSGNLGMAVAFFSYALGNLGFILAIMGR